MSAREELEDKLLYDVREGSEEWNDIMTLIKTVLDEHAHDLAETQRAQANGLAPLSRSEDIRHVVKGMRMSADLIDPETA